MANDNTQEASDAPAPALVTVTIKKPGHEHNGIVIPVGGQIAVDRETAAWLQQQQII